MNLFYTTFVTHIESESRYKRLTVMKPRRLVQVLAKTQ